jgi:tRNA (guanine-N7-)-methyltransferase
VIGAYEFLAQYVAPASAAEIHLYHPQPYRDNQQLHRRLLTPEFLALVHRSLEVGGFAIIQTDNKAYWEYLRRVAPLLFDVQELTGRWTDAPRGRTRREIYARRQGMRIYKARLHPKRELTAEAIEELVRRAPRPNFSA